MSLLRVDKSLCLPKLKSITVLLYDFSFKNENFATFIFVVKSCSTFILRHLRTFSRVLATFIKILYFSIFHFQVYIISLNGEFKMLSLNCFYRLFIQTKINKQTKQNKTVVKIHESL